MDLGRTDAKEARASPTLKSSDGSTAAPPSVAQRKKEVKAVLPVVDYEAMRQQRVEEAIGKSAEKRAQVVRDLRGSVVERKTASQPTVAPKTTKRESNSDNNNSNKKSVQWTDEEKNMAPRKDEGAFHSSDDDDDEQREEEDEEHDVESEKESVGNVEESDCDTHAAATDNALPRKPREMYREMRVPVIEVEPAKAFLDKHAWPRSLQGVLADKLLSITYRYFIVCDTSSLVKEDKRRMQMQNNDTFFASCSRWTELVDSLTFALHLSTQGVISGEFRFVNHTTEPLIVGSAPPTDLEVSENVETIQRILLQYPSGECRIAGEVEAVAREIAQEPHFDSAKGERACVWIATDSLPSDSETVNDALRPLRDLPVVVLVRLCTKDEDVVQAWRECAKSWENGLMEVIQDYNTESLRVAVNNPWITYGLPLHRLREFGLFFKELDWLSKDKLSSEAFYRVARMIFGHNRIEKIPYHEYDAHGFLEGIKSLAKKHIWDPISAKQQPWLRAEQLSKHLNISKDSNGCGIM